MRSFLNWASVSSYLYVRRHNGLYQGFIHWPQSSVLNHNLGVHNTDVDSDKIASFLKVLYAVGPLDILAAVCVKLSLLALYYQLFESRVTKSLCVIVGSIAVIWGGTTLLFELFACSPIRKAWDPAKFGSYLSQKRFHLGVQVSNILINVILLILPIRLIYHLSTSRRDNILVGILFGLGAMYDPIPAVTQWMLTSFVEWSESALYDLWSPSI